MACRLAVATGRLGRPGLAGLLYLPSSPLGIVRATWLLSSRCSVLLSVTTIVTLVTHVFSYGIRPAVAVSIIILYDFSETFYSGVIVPMEYVAPWLSWPRYVSPSYNALRIILFVNLQA